MKSANTKIALATDDGISISRHFGRARYYEIIQVTNGVEVSRERREKPGHTTFAGEGHAGDHPHGHGHGFGENAQRRHGAMIDVIVDCDVLIAGGMGNGAYQNIMHANITPIITNHHTIDQALAAYLGGTLKHDPGRLH